MTGKRHIYAKFVALLLLVSVIGGWSGSVFVSPKNAHALVPSVPTFASGGGLDRADKVGVVDRQAVDQTSKQHEIVRAAAIAAMNSAIQLMSQKLNETLEKKLGVKNFLYYQQALVEGKYLVDSMSKTHGEKAIPTRCKNGDINCVAAEFLRLPFVRALPGGEAARLGVQQSRQNPAAFALNMQKVIVGATSLFTSSISCGGIDNDAVGNSAKFLAAASAGVSASEIDPGSGPKFYEQMARLGSPYATAPFWVLQFNSLALENEAKAKQAAALELTAPGLKATQKQDASGKTQISRSLNLLSVGQENANSSLFNIAIKGGTETVYDTSSFKNFITQLLAEELSSYLAEKLAQWLGRTFRPSTAFGIRTLSTFQTVAESSARTMGSLLIRKYALGLYDKVSKMLFQGEILTESSSCRQPRKLLAFDPEDTKFTVPANVPVAVFGDKDPEIPPDGSGITPTSTPQVIFEVTPNITSGQAAILAWDASALGGGITVTLNGGSFVNQVVETQGTRTDTPAVTTIYTLTVTGPGINQSASRTVTVNATSGFQVQFDVQPRTGLLIGDVVTVTWNASAVAGADVQIFPLSATTLPVSGSRDFVVNNDTTFVLTVTSSVSAFIEVQTIDVSVINDGFEKVFGETVNQPAFGVRE